MKLQGITSVQYSIKEDLQDIQTERLIKELSEDVADSVASWYILNESANQYEINELLVNEGVKDILKKGMGKINDAITKGYSDIDAMKTKVIQGLKSKGDPGVLSKLGAIAKKNAKYIKPAMMVAVVGASLLGMDTASASEALNQIDQMGGQEFQQYADQMNQEFQNVNADGGGGSQMPQEDQPTQYQGGAGSGGNGDDTIMKVVQYGKQQGADPQKIMQALQNLKVDGMSVQDFAAKAEQAGDNNAWNKIVDALQNNNGGGGDQTAQGGGNTTTTASSSTISGDGKGGFVDQAGKSAQAPQRFDSATGKWVDSKVNRS